MRDFTHADRVAMSDRLFAQRYAQASAHDARWDGHFVTALIMSEIFCRPGCSIRTPRPSQVRFYATNAAAMARGFTPCPRCRPDTTSGPPPSGDVSLGARAVRLIHDGELDRGGVGGVAKLLGVTPRHLLREVQAVAGCGPLDVARASRAQLARLLLVVTGTPMDGVAEAAGFSSVRQFHSTMAALYRATPGSLRFGGRRRSPSVLDSGPLVVRCTMPFRKPLDAAGLFRYLADRAIPDMEEASDHWFARAVRLPHGMGHVRVDADSRGGLLARLTVADRRDFVPLYARTRDLFDLDADPVAVDARLRRDPALAAAVARRAGIRVPGAIDREEMLVRGLIEQRMPVTTARTMLGGLVSALGEATPWGPVFPTAAQIAEHGRTVLRGPGDLVDAVITVAERVAAGAIRVHAGVSAQQWEHLLGRLPGWDSSEVQYVTLRLAGRPDLLVSADLRLRRGAERLGLPADIAGLEDHGALWAPWQSYAAMHLWDAAPPLR